MGISVANNQLPGLNSPWWYPVLSLAGLGLILGVGVGLGESLIIISFGRARISVLGVGQIPFTLREAGQLVALASLIYGLLSGLLGVGFALGGRFWPGKINNPALVFARWYASLFLFIYSAVWWNKYFLEGTLVTAPISLVSTGLILLVALAGGYFLVAWLVRLWQRLSQLRYWPGTWFLIGGLIGGSIILIWLNTSSPPSQRDGVSLSTATPNEAPNVVVITLDTTRADHLGVYGYKRAHTPNLDQWAKRGTTYGQAIAQIPLTNPNHASLFTSKYPRSHGVLYNAWLLNESHTTLAEILANQQYTTASIISAFVLKTEISGLQQGFQSYDDQLSPLDPFMGLMALRVTNRLIGESLLERKADVVTDRALSWLAQRGAGPFFLWVHYFDPHFPYIPPAEYRQLHPPASDDEVARQIALYDGEISFVDAQVGRLLDQLAAEGVMDNTILVITADHGESLGEHDYYFDHGRLLYDPSLHVPLIIVYPPKVAAGLVIQDQVQTIDIMPTILHLMDLPPLEGMQGGLLPLTAGEASQTSSAFSQTFPNSEEPWNEKYSIRQDDWKFIQTPQLGTSELYDLEADPEETDNLFDNQLAIQQQLEADLREWFDTTFQFQVPPRPGALDPETQEQLERLGY
jgi:arylsulfatase A-like enzyme